MDNSWVKLYRKSKDNGIMRDYKAWTMFSWILMSVDRNTGKYTTGRFMLSDALDMNANTVKDVLKRLQKKYQVVTIKSTNKFSTIQVLNWGKYQVSSPQEDTTSVTNKTPTKHQQNTTKQEVENREVENIYIIGKSPEKKELPKGVNAIGDILQDKYERTRPYTGITKAWQDKAFRYAEKLNITLDNDIKARWLKMFRQANEGRKNTNLEKAYRYLIDYTGNLTKEEKLNYFFYIYENGLKPNNFSP